MKLKKKVLLSFFIVALCLSMLEIFLRMSKAVYLRVENESIYPNLYGDYKPSQDLFADYILPHHIKINSFGLRGNEIAVRKPRGTYRILVLGDSYTYGARVSNDETFPFVLEKFLNSYHKEQSPKIEVINAGHSAYSTREEYEYLLERGAYLDPDLVILAWFPNDIIELSRKYSWRDLLKSHYKFEPLKSYLRSFAIFNTLRLAVSYAYIRFRFGPYVPKENIDIFDNEVTQTEECLWNKCFDYVLKIKDFCNNNGIKFALVALLDYGQFNREGGFYPQAKLKEFTAANQIDFFDITKCFASQEDIRKLYLLPKDPHFSPLGNHLVADHLSIFLKSIFTKSQER